MQCVPEACVPYSEQACLDSVTSLGLEKGGNGYEFSGDYGTKGCYAYESGTYANMAFYGKGGTEIQMKESLESPNYRPYGYDCNATG